MKELTTYFEDVANTCIECGLCTRIQDESGCYTQTYATQARHMLEALAQGAYEDVSDQIWSCTLCGACTARCPVHIDAHEFAYYARCVLNPAQPSIIEQFAPMRTDLESNLYRQLRKLHEDTLPEEAVEGSCGALFFPGCALAAYAPGLTSTVFAHLKSSGAVEGILYGCCGSPFYFMGDTQLLESRARELACNLEAHGTHTIITACASCQAALELYRKKGIFDETLQIVPLPVVLAQQGFTVDPQALQDLGYSSASLKDVCRDRDNGVFASSVRQLLSSCEVVELEHVRRDSRCCGSGGLVSLYDEDVSDDKRWAILSEFDDTGASCLVTMCINCSIALRQDGDSNIVHYLELLFREPIDWAAVEQEVETVLANR